MQAGTVYVVEPDTLERESLGKILRDAGYTPQLFSSAEACLAHDSIVEPKLLLLSLELPGTRADEWCVKLRSDPKWGRTPIIITTTTDQPHELMYCWRAAADDFLTKPVSSSKLLPKLKALEKPLVRALGPKGDRPSHGVLLADASRFFRNTTGGNLEQAGVRVLYAQSAPEALSLATENARELDACLIDLSLPGRDVIELIAELRHQPRLQRVPVFVMYSTDLSEEQHAKLEALRLALFDKRNLPFEMLLSRVFRAMQPEMTELRAAERRPFFTVVEFRRGEEEWSMGFSYDVSPGGMFVRTLTPLPMQSEITLRTRFPEQAISKGTVVWANPFERRTAFTAPVGMGICLKEIAPQLAHQVRGLIRRPNDQFAKKGWPRIA